MTTTVKLSQLIPDMKCNSRRDHVDSAMRELIAPKAKAKGWLPKILAKLRKPAADNVVEVKPQKRKKAA